MKIQDKRIRKAINKLNAKAREHIKLKAKLDHTTHLLEMGIHSRIIEAYRNAITIIRECVTEEP